MTVPSPISSLNKHKSLSGSWPLASFPSGRDCYFIFLKIFIYLAANVCRKDKAQHGQGGGGVDDAQSEQKSTKNNAALKSI